jgi:hypothetical protein
MDLQKLKAELSSTYKYRIELHAHTAPVSGCSEVTPKEMIETYKRLGYAAVVVANHFLYQHDARDKETYINYFLNDFEETAKYGKELGVQVYLGAEIRFTENNNDYLVFGVDKKILEDIYEYLPYGVENFRKNYAMPDSAFIQAHPMRKGMESVDPAILDGIEVFNMHPNHNSRVGLASVYAQENKHFVITAGSDFHHPNMNHEGLAAIRAAYLPENSFSLAKFLKEGDFLLEIGRENLVLR